MDYFTQPSHCISIGNSMICSDIRHKYHEWYFEIVIRNLRPFWSITGGAKKNRVFVCRNLLDGSSLHSFFSQERSLNDFEKFPERLVCILELPWALKEQVASRSCNWQLISSVCETPAFFNELTNKTTDIFFFCTSISCHITKNF